MREPMTVTFGAHLRSFAADGQPTGEGRTMVRLQWDPAASAELWMTVDGVEWVMARSLLCDGLDAEKSPAGQGEVLAWRDGMFLAVVLRSPHGQATLLLPYAQAAAWLARTRATVPTGAECSGVHEAEWDRWLTLITRGARDG